VKRTGAVSFLQPDFKHNSGIPTTHVSPVILNPTSSPNFINSVDLFIYVSCVKGVSVVFLIVLILIFIVPIVLIVLNVHTVLYIFLYKDTC